jgi:hypothetical protein
MYSYCNFHPCLSFTFHSFYTKQYLKKPLFTLCLGWHNILLKGGYHVTVVALGPCCRGETKLRRFVPTPSLASILAMGLAERTITLVARMGPLVYDTAC